MKKAIALAVCMLLIPFTAFSMEMVSDEEMDNVTGQSGVAITIDDVVVHNSGIEETWYQNDITGANDTAAVGMVDPNDRESMMFVNALVAHPGNNTTQTGDYDQLGTYNDLDSLHNDATGSDYTHEPSPLTIQVAQTGVFASAGGSSAFNDAGITDATAVIIGLPTVEIYNEGTDAMQLLVSASANPIGDERGDTGVSSFGTLYSGGGSSTAILDGQIEISPVEEVH